MKTRRQRMMTMTPPKGKKPKLGSGGRFRALEKTLSAKKGKSKVSNPGALAAYIGRKKFGAKKMAKMSAAGKKK